MTIKNFVVKNGLSVGNVTIDAASGNITTTNANLGNLLTANYANFANDVTILGNLTATGTNVAITNANVSNLNVSTYANLGNVGNVYIGGGNVGAVLSTDGNGNLSWSSAPQVNEIQNGASNVYIAAANSNVTTAVAGSTILTVSATGANITGTANVTGNLSAANANLGNLAVANYVTGTLTTASQPNVTSVGTLTGLSVDGSNITLANGVYVGNGSGLTALTGANVTGNVANANLAGYVTQAAQSNITSVGTLTSLAVTGNLSAGNANLGNLATANFANFANDVVVTGNLSAGNANLGNAVTANYANFANDVVVTGNLSAGNANLGNAVTANYANFANDVTVTGNLSAGNITSNGNITINTGSGGNLTGANVITANTVLAGNIGNASSFLTGEGNAIANIAGANVTGNVANANLAGYVTQNAQSNITSVGTLTALGVSGTITAANITANTGIFTGNGSGLTALTGANVTGQVGNALVAGTVYTNAQPNITSVGTLTSLTVANAGAGNIIADNANLGNLVLANFANVSGNVVAGNVFANANIQANSTVLANAVSSVSGSITISTTANADVVLAPNGTGNINASNTYINNVADPVAAQDAATKMYVDTLVQGLSPKEAVEYATTTNLPSYTYNNGTSGVGATLTGSANGALTIDSATVAVSQRILVKDETSTNAPYNGIYVVSVAGSGADAYVLTRAADFDLPAQVPGAYTFVVAGTVNAGAGYTCTTVDPVVIGTTAITFTQFSGAGTYSAGTGLTLTGTQFSISNTAVTAGSYGDGDQVATFTVNGQGQLTAASNTHITANAANLSGTVLASGIVTSSLTTVGTITSGTWNANFASGVDGANIGNLTGSNVQGNVTSAITANFANYAGNVTVAAQPNITSVGTLTSLTVNAAGGTGNLTVDNANVLGNLSAGTITVGTGTGGNVSGANVITANYFVGDGSNLSAIAGGNVTGQVGNALVAGTVYGATQGNITSAANLVTVGTITSGTWNAYFASGVDGANLANITGGNVTGQVGNALVAGTVYTNAQPNITSVGTLTSLTIANSGAGNLVADNANLGNAATANYFGVAVATTSTRTNTTVTTSGVVIDTFPAASYRTAKYVISASSANGYQSVEALVVQNGSDAFMTVYASITDGTIDLIDLSATLAAGNVSLTASANASVAATASVNLVATYVQA